MPRYLGTSHIVSPAGFGLGYLPQSARSAWTTDWPLLHTLLTRLDAANALPSKGTGQGLSLFGRHFDQGPSGSCTEQSTCKAVRVTLTGRGHALPAGCDDFSPDFGYKSVRALEAVRALRSPTDPLPEKLADTGAEPDDCIRSAEIDGLVGMPSGHLTSDNRYNDVEIGALGDYPSLAVEEAAELALGAHDVDLSASDVSDQLAAASNTDLGSTLAMFVDEAFMNWDPNAGPVTHIDLRDPRGGGHQMCGPLTYEDSPSLGRIWTVGNSWGTSYGVGGNVTITHTCLMTALDRAIVYDVHLKALRAPGA